MRPLNTRFRWELLVSIAAHAAMVVALLASLRVHAPVLTPRHLPGTLQGSHLLLSYSLGAPAASARGGLLHPEAPRSVVRKPAPSPLKPSLAAPSKPLAEVGSGNSGDSALGDENIRVALPQVHPRPQPDLSTLPHGTAGDVVVDVIIDDTGKVTTATLVKGLGAPVDDTVVAALRAWVFAPATRNGQNIASEQEILIHYERG